MISFFCRAADNFEDAPLSAKNLACTSSGSLVRIGKRLVGNWLARLIKAPRLKLGVCITKVLTPPKRRTRRTSPAPRVDGTILATAPFVRHRSVTGLTHAKKFYKFDGLYGLTPKVAFNPDLCQMELLEIAEALLFGLRPLQQNTNNGLPATMPQKIKS
jgi:hypothetical protein